MATDAAKHTVPAATDHPARSDFLKLSLSMRDAIPIANTAGRATQLASLAASSPAVTPSSSNPILFEQADLPAGYRYIYTVDGTNFIALSGVFVWADGTARGAATTMAAGDKGYQLDTKITWRYDGSAWKPWDSDWLGHAPTLTNMSQGNGTLSCRYQYEAGNINYHFGFLLGSTSTVTGVPVFTIPANAYALLATRELYDGSAQIWDASTTVRSVCVVASNGSAVDAVAVLATGGTNGSTQNPTSSFPVATAWAAGDAITADFTYRPA